MSRKLTRLVLAGSVAAAFTLAPAFSAYAATDRNVFAADAKFSGKIDNETQKPTTDALPGDRVLWHITNGEHTVRPDEAVGAPWPAAAQPSEKLTSDSPKYAVTFDQPGKYHFYCELHNGMVGVINVKDQSSSTTPPPPPPPPPPTTTTTRPAVVPGPTTTTTSAPASSAGTKPPGSAAPAPTTTSTKPAKDSKDKKKDDKPKQEETTTTTAPPPPGPVDIPDEAIIPVLPGSQTATTTQNGVEVPTSTPEGEAIALLKANKGGGKAKSLLLVSGVGLGVLGLGAAGYKWANRSSRYFPA